MLLKFFTFLIPIVLFNNIAFAIQPEGKDNRPGCIKNLPTVKSSQPYYGHCVENNNTLDEESKIKLRIKNCSQEECDDIEFNLDHGDCRAVIEKGALSPKALHRYCARIALPEMKISNLSVESQSQLLKEKISLKGSYNNYSADPSINKLGVNTQKLQLCLYHNREAIESDPSKKGSIQDNRIKNYGLFDEDINFQPFHTKSDVNSRTYQFTEYLKKNPWLYQIEKNKDEAKAEKQIINWWNKTSSVKIPDKWAKSFAKKILISVKNSAINWPDIYNVDVALGQKPNNKKSLQYSSELIKNILTKYIIDSGGIDEILKTHLEKNGLSSETSQILHCFDISNTGSLPPPYPDKLKYDKAPDIQAMQICPTNQNGELEISSIDTSGCVNSDTPNNFIKNSVRISLNTPVQFCSVLKKTNPVAHDQINDEFNNSQKPSCFHLKNEHNLPPKNNIISRCKKDTSDPCLEQDLSIRIYPNQARILFSDSEFNQSSISESFNPNKDSICGPLNKSNCKHMWGVNIGQYQDIKIDFTKTKAIYGTQVKSNIVTLMHNNSSFSFEARIGTKTTSYNNVEALRNQICVYNINNYEYTNDLISCFKRPKPMQPVIDDCGKHPNKNCQSNYFKPAAYITLPGGLEGVAKAQYYSRSKQSQNTLNLAGYDYKLFVIDNNYLNDVTNTRPIESSNEYEYNEKIDYINGSYLMGGAYMCLKSLTPDYYALNNPKYKVLAKINKLSGLEFDINSLRTELNDNTSTYKSSEYNYSKYCNKEPDTKKIQPHYQLKATSAGKQYSINIYREEISYQGVNAKMQCYTHDYKENNQYLVKPLYSVSHDPKDTIELNNETEIPAYCVNQDKLNNEIQDVKKTCPSILLHDPKSHVACQDFDVESEKDCNIPQNKKLNFIKLQKCDKKEYVYKISPNSYDENRCIMRDKNAYEYNNCIPLEKPTKCLAIKEDNADWTEAEFGEYSTGTCVSGFEAKDASLLTRLCTIYYSPDSNTQASGVLKRIKAPICTPKSNNTNP